MTIRRWPGNGQAVVAAHPDYADAIIADPSLVGEIGGCKIKRIERLGREAYVDDLTISYEGIFPYPHP